MECREIIAKYIESLESGFKCLLSEKRVRIITPYCYPDNDLIEVFIEELPQERIIVTDLGETLRHLHSQGFDVLSSRKRNFLAETIATRGEVEFTNGRLSKVGIVSQIGDLMFDVITASRGIADLIYTSRAYEPATFFEEVKDFLEQNEQRFESKVRIHGTSEKAYTVDFRILNGYESYLQTLSPVSYQGVKSKVDATFRMWSDFNGKLRKLSLLNDVDFEWRSPDVIILGRVSTVHYWSRKQEIISSLIG